MDSGHDYSHNAVAEVRRMKCPCLTCGKYQGEYEDTGNGLYIVYCSDGKTRCVDYISPCVLYDDEFEGVKDVN